MNKELNAWRFRFPNLEKVSRPRTDNEMVEFFRQAYPKYEYRIIDDVISLKLTEFQK